MNRDLLSGCLIFVFPHCNLDSRAVSQAGYQSGLYGMAQVLLKYKKYL